MIPVTNRLTGAGLTIASLLFLGCQAHEATSPSRTMPLVQLGAAQQALPPTITFKGLKNGCKVFDITDKDNLGRPTTVSKIEVQGFEIKSVTSTGPHAITKGPGPGLTDLFTIEYLPPQESITITVCPVANFKSSSYSIRAFHTGGNAVSSELSVSEQSSLSNFGVTFVGLFDIPKPFEKVNIDKLQKSVVTDNIKDIKIFKRKFREEFTTVNVNGTLIDPTKPGTATLIADPPGQIFLLVLEVCAVFQQGAPGSNVINAAVCPTDVPLLIPLPPLPPPLPGERVLRLITACRAVELAIEQFDDDDVEVRDQAVASARAHLLAESKSIFLAVLSALGSVSESEFNDPNSAFNRRRRALEDESCLFILLRKAVTSTNPEVSGRARAVLAGGIFNPFRK